ncbi:MAG: HAMP domain-containing histidine kinase [Lachnospiraceae bacterium]|nr:HAMP domain-containing histidine kinase [Lachnospiraceae bacterium]MDE6627281.1 HAMP domain-containing histidine kinase [Lachnospiraceae bacterium]
MKKSKSLGKTLCFVGVALIASFVLLNLILTYFLLIPFSTYLSIRQMKELAVSISDRDDYEDTSFLQYIQELNDDLNTRITIVDRDKNIINTTRLGYYQEGKLGKVSGRYFEANLNAMDSGKTVSWSRTGESTNKVEVRVITKVADNRYAVLSRSYRSLQNATKSALIFELLSGVLLILVSIIVVFFTSRRLVVPIRRMTAVAEHISNMEFDARVEVTTKDELGMLGTSINRMSEHLENNLEMLQNDIEKRKRLVRNLSHEIKSPVAVIMGYADRLKAVISKNPEKAVNYCSVISDECNRINVLVTEMLELSRFEQQMEVLNREDIPAERFFNSVRTHFENTILDREVTYQENYDSQDVFQGDYILLERAVDNLLRNAVGHSGDKNPVIQITGNWNKDYYEIHVYNSGSYIAEEDRENIWDAFTKVDKVRGRGQQGSGVGLTIVREIVDAHGGYYHICNKESGVEITIAIKGK